MTCCGNKNYLLIISLLLNAFLGGYLISHLICRPHGGPMMGAHGGPNEFMRHALKELSPESRTKVEAVLDKYKPKHSGPEKMGKHIDEMRSILTSPKFDKTKFEAVENNLHADERGMHDNISTMVQEIVKTLNDEERIKFFAKAFPPAPDMGHPPEDGDHGDDAPHGHDHPPQEPDEEK